MAVRISVDRWSAVHTAAAAASYFPLPAHAPYCQLCVILCESYWSVAPFAAVVLSRLIHFSQRTEEPFFFFIFFLLSLPPLVVLMEEEMLGRWLGEFSNQCFAFTLTFIAAHHLFLFCRKTLPQVEAFSIFNVKPYIFVDNNNIRSC